MLYELIAVVRAGNTTVAKEIATSTARTLLSGHPTIIRSISNWGQFDLPRPTTKHQHQHFQGHTLIMTFDTSPAATAEIKRNLSLDPRMIRFHVVKMGDKLGNKRPGGIEGVGSEGTVWKALEEREEIVRQASQGSALAHATRNQFRAGRI